MRDGGSEINNHWELIPSNIDILVTHGPPFGYGDDSNQGRCGCQNLLTRVEVVKPTLHIFGHNHEGYGIQTNGETIFVNAASVNHSYRPVNSPIVIDVTVP
eukprot:TRINITY_DN494_c0_g1_i1.p1 TRINITY_DN494_c0_g1~~TRINITY_DN494_c0_g1_i1.p1  ORF type:complete len:101 (-),score=11.79 TRINITY_DN494_c0_g1_i1:77-379(-)